MRRELSGWFRQRWWRGRRREPERVCAPALSTEGSERSAWSPRTGGWRTTQCRATGLRCRGLVVMRGMSLAATFPKVRQGPSGCVRWPHVCRNTEPPKGADRLPHRRHIGCSQQVDEILGTYRFDPRVRMRGLTSEIEISGSTGGETGVIGCGETRAKGEGSDGSEGEHRCDPEGLRGVSER